MKKFIVELDVSHEASVSDVAEFANGHGCYITSVIENGPAGGNPCYTFASESFSKMKGMIEEFFGGQGFDEEQIKTMIVEV